MTVRNLRRVHARTMDAARRTGGWPPWESSPVQAGAVDCDGGWTLGIHTAWSNGVYAVLVRTVGTAWGPVEHAAIRNIKGSRDVPWTEKQRIKNEIFGEDRLAVEVFPPVKEVVNAAHMYHLWVFPPGFRLPFMI